MWSVFRAGTVTYRLQRIRNGGSKGRHGAIGGAVS